jgi:pantoate--beta-alanine ligase
VFGEKDFQQLAIVRRMVTDLDLGVAIVGLPTVREADGLAMSSRNRRLSAEQRSAAVCIPRSLRAMREELGRGQRHAAGLLDAAEAVVTAEPLARLEYVTIVDPESLEPVDPVDSAAQALTAVWFGDVRLIDNVRLNG